MALLPSPAPGAGVSWARIHLGFDLVSWELGASPSLLGSTASPSLKWKDLRGLRTQEGRDGQEGVMLLPALQTAPGQELVRKREGPFKTHLKTEVFQTLCNFT